MDVQTKRGGVGLDFYNQWEALRHRRCNWYDFTVLHLTFEYSPYKRSAEVQVGLLGLNLRVTIYRKAPAVIPLTVEVDLYDIPDKGDL